MKSLFQNRAYMRLHTGAQSQFGDIIVSTEVVLLILVHQVCMYVGHNKPNCFQLLRHAQRRCQQVSNLHNPPSPPLPPKRKGKMRKGEFLKISIESWASKIANGRKMCLTGDLSCDHR